jgi:hypothetical protein
MRPLPTFLLSLCAAAVLAGCSPTYNWRDYHSQDAPYSVMFPDKPATHTRKVTLDGFEVSMNMAAAEVEGTIFAVGSAEAPSDEQADAALTAMQTALVRNIGATVESEKPGKLSSAANAGAARARAVDLVANGIQRGQPIRLVAHLESRNRRVYQVIVIGKPAKASGENVDMFLSSFKLN